MDLGFNILFHQNQIGKQKEQCRKGKTTEEKTNQSASHHVLRFVGVHAQDHQGIGPEQAGIFAGRQQAHNTSAQGQQDGQGEAADDQREEQLKRDDGKASDGSS